MKESIIFYRSFYEAIKNLSAKDRLQVYDAIFSYGLDLKEIELKGLPNALFRLIKPQLDANQAKYENGKKGGRPKTETKPKNNLSITETKPNANVFNVNVNDNEKGAAFNFSLDSETIKTTARTVFDDGIWADAIGIGHSLSREDLGKWMAQFNASLVGDNISNFSVSTYKKMFGGWLHKQKSKGYKLPEQSKQAGPPVKIINQ